MAKGKYQQWLEPDGLLLIEGSGRNYTIESAVGMVVRSGLKRLSGEISLLDLETLTNSKDLIQEMSLKSLLQIKTGNYTKESNCMYLLMGDSKNSDYLL